MLVPRLFALQAVHPSRLSCSGPLAKLVLCRSLSRHGFAVAADRSLYSRCSNSGVAEPGLLFRSINPPAFRMAATNSAQKNDFSFVLRGQSKERTIPEFENGLPTHFVFAKASILLVAFLLQPSCKYVYCGFRPVRSTSSTPISSLKTRQTLLITPFRPDSSPIAISTCVRLEN